MDNWRNKILQEFTPQVARLTLVADPDGLLTEEGVIQGLGERGFELIAFEDPIAFRYAYESKYRSRWDRGESTELVVVLRAEMEDLSSLPFDLLQAGRKLSFNLGDLFPNLSYPIMEALDKAYLDAIYRTQLQYKPETLGDNATKDFLMLHVFETAPELVKRPSDLLSVLLRRHFRNQNVPSVLDERFIQVLRKNEVFKRWPLGNIVPDRDAFFAFLQERWPAFLDRLFVKGSEKIGEGEESFGLEFNGPLEIPFEHDDVRVYIDNLFYEGLLQSVFHPHADELSKTWVSSGIKLDPKADLLRRLVGLINDVESSLPNQEARHREWINFAQRWAELIVLLSEAEKMATTETMERIANVRKDVGNNFFLWVQKRFAGLYNQPSIPPVMVHHIPRAMARYIADFKNSKIALIVIDGLSLDQWIILRNTLFEQRSNLQFREDAVFAWIPTTTSVSRQALFSGKLPLYFPESIHSTDKESLLWHKFWLDQNLSQAQIVYMKGLGNEDLDKIKESLEHPQVNVAGLVISKVDKIMHGIELGTVGMHNQVRQWAFLGYLAELVDLLHEFDFFIWITSDHGNIEAGGCGRPAEGVIADVRGERVRVFSDQLLRSKVKEKFPDAQEWPSIGLPEDYLPLLAHERFAFIHESKRTVAHGGISIEEVIVPLIQIERKAN